LGGTGLLDSLIFVNNQKEKNMKRITAMFLMLGFLVFMAQAGLVSAQNQKMEAPARAAFKQLLAETDKNHDGKISRAEHLPIWKDKDYGEKNFKMWDLNNDGYITEEEYVKAVGNITRERKPSR
jgi:Ca2+-binding EF-hand superfamily protein